jgi:sugar phosphate isomerase/epimerase
MLTRREFGGLALGGMLAGPRIAGVGADATIAGVRVGVQTYSFRDLPRTSDGDAVGPIIDAMTACGFAECELYAPQIEPDDLSRERLRAWRVGTPLDYFHGIKRRFDAAGITVYAFNYSATMEYSDAEIDRGFEIARALGAEIITASATLESARRIAPYAERHRMTVAMHGHSNVRDPNQFATPESFAAAMKMSPRFKVNLDIGHFTAAGFDAVPYIREHHADITNLHIKDMRRNVPESYVPWGQGNAPIREVLQLLKRERWPIRAYVEYEYRGEGSPVEEAKKCLAFVRQALA